MDTSSLPEPVKPHVMSASRAAIAGSVAGGVAGCSRNGAVTVSLTVVVGAVWSRMKVPVVSPDLNVPPPTGGRNLSSRFSLRSFWSSTIASISLPSSDSLGIEKDEVPASRCATCSAVRSVRMARRYPPQSL